MNVDEILLHFREGTSDNDIEGCKLHEAGIF